MSSESLIVTVSAHVFQIDPTTKKTWQPISSKSLPVQIYHNEETNVYRIISIDGSSPIINNLIRPGMNFTKTAQKFGQWADKPAGVVFGLGFSVETDLITFKTEFEAAVRNSAAKKEKAAEQPPPPPPPEDPAPTTFKSHSQPPPPQPKPQPRQDPVAKERETEQLRINEDLKYENERLKQALATSGTNAKKWEHELQTLKSNNTKLKQALKDSAANVEDWRRQLTAWKESCGRLEGRVRELEAENTRASQSISAELAQGKAVLQKKVSTLESQISELRETIAILTKEKSDYLSQKQKDADTLAEMKSFRDRVRSWQQEFAMQMQSFEGLSAKMPREN